MSRLIPEYTETVNKIREKEKEILERQTSLREEIYQAARSLVLTGEESNLSPKSYSAAMERLFRYLVKLCKEFENV